VATTSYISIGGMIVGESTDGVNRAYGLDALGSVVATYTGTSVQNTYQYKPYGAQLAKTGTAADPSYTWNGGSGYRASTTITSLCYVRSRHYLPNTCTWATCDLTWPNESAFTYTRGRPVTLADPTGLLGYEAVGAWNANLTGIYNTWINWNGVGGLTGWIVQHVWFDGTITNCKGRPVGQWSHEWYEYWEVINGQVFCCIPGVGPLPNPKFAPGMDTWSQSTKNKSVTTSYTQVGDAVFTSTKPPHLGQFICGNPNTPWAGNALFAATKDWSGWDTICPTGCTFVVQTLDYLGDCCASPHSGYLKRVPPQKVTPVDSC